ncbi:MAG: aminotransferase class V-fold PLP-dependent enzyme [Solirubrobacteraceae bacterium]|nr:aminotransferase class V-fold PLP-dependent enzyme [Solirubrobacteraceae bacterium]
MTDQPAADPLAEIERSLKPYRGELPTHARLPEEGVPREEVLGQLRRMADAEREKWEGGHVSGAVYEGEAEHIAFLNEAYAIHSQSNPLHLDVWPSAAKFEAEIVAMTAGMLGAEETPDAIVGTVTSGGTESIMLAMRAYRERGRANGIERPVMVLCETAHAAFDKAADAFGIEQRKVPAGPGHVADVAAMEAAIDERTVVVIGSAPAFPHGLVDPIAELSEIARARGIGFHTDGCLGGFLLPWAAKLGHEVPAFDFRLPGVTSMSRPRAPPSCSTAARSCAAISTSPSPTGPAGSTRRRPSPARAPAGSAPRAGRRWSRSASPATSRPRGGSSPPPTR